MVSFLTAKRQFAPDWTAKLAGLRLKVYLSLSCVIKVNIMSVYVVGQVAASMGRPVVASVPSVWPAASLEVISVITLLYSASGMET